MKPIPSKKVAAFLCAVANTREQEINCTECLHLSGELAEAKLAERTLNPRLEQVVQHLSVCPECQVQFDVLEQLLQREQ